MPAFVVPEIVARLIADSIDSIPELETILLLREHPEVEWNVARVAHRIYVDERNAAELLEKLSGKGFCSLQAGGYRYAPATPELDAAVSELAHTYARRVVAVTQLIHKKPSASVRQFAAAFRIRKEK
jgi:hypothetical protein